MRTPSSAPSRFVVALADVSMDDVARVGGKNASLGEMIRSLREAGVPVPDGFATTAEAYRRFLAENDLDAVLDDHVARLHDGGASLEEVGAADEPAEDPWDS